MKKATILRSYLRVINMNMSVSRRLFMPIMSNINPLEIDNYSSCSDIPEIKEFTTYYPDGITIKEEKNLDSVQKK